MNRRQFGSLPIAGFLGQAPKPIARPSADQLAWQDMEMAMFVHFAPNTWQDREYDDLSTPLDKIQPVKLDTDQWVSVAKSMGAKQIVFVAKHAGGFCWWQTETTKYGAKDLSWRGGKADLMADLARSTKRAGLKMGVYLSPQDKSLEIGVGGKAATPEAQVKYDAIFRQQLTELLSRYGDMNEVWFDGSSAVDVGDILKKHAPHAMVFQSKYCTIRWVGNEQGYAPDPEWNSVSAEAAASGVATGKDGNPDGAVWLPNECDARMRREWFWNTKNAESLKSVDQLMLMYYRSVGHGSLLLLNHTPDTTGAIPEPDAKRASEFGEEIRRRFDEPMAETKGTGRILELRLPKAAKIDHVVLMEEIRNGERIRKYLLEGLTETGWKPLSHGTAVGHKKIDPFPAKELFRVRLRVQETSGDPILKKFSAHAVGKGEGLAPIDTFETHILRTWDSKSVKTGEDNWDMDVSAIAEAAGQYEVEFLSYGGEHRLSVDSLTLLHGATESPEFVRRIGRSNQFRVTITGVGERLRLRAKVTGSGPDTFGQVMLRQLE